MRRLLTSPPSLALRLTISIGAGITALLLCFGWLVERSINAHFVEQDIHELNAAKTSIQATLRQFDDETAANALKAHFDSTLSGHHNAEFLVADSNGQVLYATPGANLEAALGQLTPVDEINNKTVSPWQHEGKTFRSVLVRLAAGTGQKVEPFSVVLATDIDFHLHFLNSFHRYLWWLTAVACLIAIAATWLAVHQGHAPIRRISQQINRINSEQLHLRLDSTGVPAELAPMATAFNEMIDRLEDGFRRLSNFSGDIAHELRTPITNLTTQTQVALSRARTAQEYREILYSNLEEYERMAKMIGDMLFLAKADNGLIEPERAAVPLVAELRELADFFEAWCEERKVAIVVTGDETLAAHADRAMVRRAFSNLLSNAIRYTPEGGTVRVNVRGESDTVRICITNPGPTIAAEHLPHIFERFYRPDASRHRNGEGAGLGLAIVKSIVQAHGGQVGASSDNGVTHFEVFLKHTQRP
ncbi:heavy metal sensor histidine kinase [Pusillimonas sp. NJUB218]|uniref:heavy metal sensor histidine kinase n=1 Tax=Pusillimonas sp. NJUB218 TaxID=2023230 RepID=UPI000F4B0841|nr:heavy metal sensor histidine kinase [Pusillimonas sp. NJUB218]ROT46731.1 two-component sensor histidine kinase [Pusillimonas sp. NJUB218]